MNAFLNDIRKHWRSDLLAGLTGAVAGAPQAMGFALLAGLNPIYGLYTAFISTLVAPIFGSSVYMTVGPTNALALVVGSTLIGLQGTAMLDALFTLTLLVGVFLLAFGLFRLGGLTRFVSNAVMTGFISGAGVLIILAQLSHLTGYDAEGTHILQRTWDWLLHLPDADWPTFAVGLMAMAIIIGLHRTRLKPVATLFALILTAALTALLGLESVETVRDMSAIPTGLPLPVLPDFTLIPDLWLAALAMAVLTAVQSAGIVESVPQPDGHLADTSRDFNGQGIANIVGSFFQNMPSGASLSRTAVNISAGGKTKLANIVAGLFVGLALIAIGGLIERIVLTALAAHLIVAANSLISYKNIKMVWNVGVTAQLAMLTTFASTLLLPLEYSIYVGVALSMVMYIYSSSMNVEITRLLPADNHHYREKDVPNNLSSENKPIILSVYGHLYFAAVRRLEQLLPPPDNCQYPIVILRLRHNQYLGSTGIRVLQRYAHSLQQRGGRLMLVGVSPLLHRQLERTGALQFFGPENIYDADEIIFKSTEDAYQDACEWLARQNGASSLMENSAVDEHQQRG